MKAGFSRQDITPPLGTRMLGWGDRDEASGCKGVHDPIFVRACYVEHDGEPALIASFDLCFLAREDADRFKGVLGREFDLLPRQILLSATHNHAGPGVGTWDVARYGGPDRLYLLQLEAALLRAAREARETARPCTIAAGVGKSKLPMSRRRNVNGKFQNAPNPGGTVCDTLPVCLLKDLSGKPIALLFSTSTHPVIFKGFDISAEYPGVASNLLDAHLGATCSLFLQGVAGDSRPSNLAKGDTWNWGSGAPEMKQAGEMLASEVIGVLRTGLKDAEPRVASAIEETRWPIQDSGGRAAFEAVLKKHAHGTTPFDDRQRKWAAWQISRIDRSIQPDHIPVVLQGIQLAQGVRLVALEGEPVAAHGLAMLRSYKNEGVTFPLGYANGEAAYLVTSPMLDEGGYEPECFAEYGHGASLAKGMENVLDASLAGMQRRGVM